MKRLFSLLLLLVFCTLSILPVCADGSRVNESPKPAGRLITKQFNTNADSLYLGNPNSGSKVLSSATGKSGNDGDVTVTLSAGFTPSATLTCWWWNAPEAKWVHSGPDAATYSKAFDATYTSAQFSVPPYTAFMVTSDVHITGNVYVSGTYEPTNNNSATGYDQ